MSLGHTRILIAGAFAGVLAVACDVHGVFAPGTVVSLTISANVTLTAGSTQQMTALGYDADGRSVPVSPTWTIAAGGGTISSTGMFSAGTTAGWFANTVVASVGRISANASVTVTPGALASIAVGPGPAVTLAVGGITRFIAVGMDAWGNDVPITPTWSVVAGGGTITADGVFCAGGALGTFPNTVQASSQGVKAFATVNVTVGPLERITLTPNASTLPVGAKQQFTVVGTDASGNNVPVDATWAVVAYGGTIDQAGLFTAGSVPGTFPNTIEATSGTLSVTASVTVTAGPLATITVTPTPTTLAISATQQFTAVGKDASGNVVAITPTWSVAASGGTINSSTGVFTAGTTPGTFTNTVRATSGAISGTATVTVTAGPLATITVTPTPTTLVISATQQFTAVGTDASGNVVAIAPTWSVVANGGTISSTGVFTAGTTPGTFTNTVTATSGAISGTATVTVTAGPLATITVTPAPATVTVSGTQQFTAVGKDASGNVIAITPTWSVAASGGTISSTGVFTAGTTPGTFTNTVTATSGAISGTATVIVTAGSATTISIFGGNAQSGSCGYNLTNPIVVRVSDAGGNSVAGTTVNFGVLTGGGSVGTASGVSDVNGQVQTTWMLGNGGTPQTLSATSAGLTNSPLTITATTNCGEEIRGTFSAALLQPLTVSGFSVPAGQLFAWPPATKPRTIRAVLQAGPDR